MKQNYSTIDLWTASTKVLKDLFMMGEITKNTYASIILGHKSEVEPDWGSQGRYIINPKFQEGAVEDNE